VFLVEDHLSDDGWVVAHDLTRRNTACSIAVCSYALQCRLYVGCRGPGSEVGGADDKRACCAANGEAMPRQQLILYRGKDVGLMCIIDGGSYSVCACYL
jgi:hypothetical protein